MKQKNKRTLREDFRLLARAFRIWHEISPTYWLFQALPILTDTFLPYFAVYISAELLNELAGGRNPQKMLWLAVVTVAGSFILNLLTRILQLHTTLVSADFEQRKRIYIFDRENAFQYEHLENSDVILERQELSTIENSTGGGFRKVSEAVGSLLKGLLNIAFSVALTISMFRMRATGQVSGVLGFVNSPYSSVVIIALVLINAVLGIRIATVRTEKLAEATSTLSAFNTRYFTFADNFGPDMIVFRLNRLVNDEFEKHSLHPVWIDGIARVNIRYNSFSILLSAVTHLSVFLFTAAKAYIGVFGIGSLVLYQSTVERFINAVAITTKAVGELRFNNQYLEKLYNYLDLPNEMYKGTLAVEKRDDIDYEIEFRDVSFKYPRTEAWALRHVNLKFKIGDKLAIVGENGSGKTTFIKLLCRLYDPTEGKILLNGIDITRYRYDEYLAVVRRDRLRDPAKVGQRIVVDPDPVRDVAAGHAFDIEIVAERQGGNKDGYGRGQTGIVTVVERQRFTGEIQFQIDAGNALDVEGNLGAVEPVRVAAAELTVAQGSPPVHRPCSVVLLPQVLERLSFSGQSAVHFLLVEVPVQIGIDRIPSFSVQNALDKLVGDLFRKGIRQFRAFPETFQKLVYRGLSIAGDFGDFPAAHPIGEMEHEHSLVVHMRTSSNGFLLQKEVFPL